ncbi:hypothetical protein AB0O64_16330 [Streptomyces sp. NPDC088341]|uniref:hypothetical protein n=1 Tax=Streptomyces sp. NPDC088341 TaxID=3154870 RepID=UPI0034349D0F
MYSRTEFRRTDDHEESIMNTALRITVFAAALAASFGAAYGIGSVVAPVRTDPEPAPRVEHGEGHGESVGGPRVSRSGYTFDPE